MTTVNLACREGHTFEAWFRSKAEFSRQHEAGLVACPWCGARDIERRPSLPNVMRSRGKGGRTERSGAVSEADGNPSPSMQSFASTLRAFHRYIERTCDNVGDRFAIEARKMHEQNEEREEQKEREERIAEQAARQAEGGAEREAEREAEMFPRSKRGRREKEKEVARGIYGQASAEELCALEEEGISVHPLPPLPSRYN